MKTFLLTFCTYLILSSCTGQKKKSVSDKLPSVKDRINTLFNFESKQGSLLTCDEEKLFLSALPRNFQEYKNFFCKRHTLSDGRKLYLTRTLSLFQNLYCIKSEKLIESLFDLSKNANIEDGCDTFSKGSRGGYFDAVINLQEIVQSIFAKEVATAVYVLQQSKDDEILSFWHFYFDGPHPESYKNDFNILYERYSKENERIAKLMKQSYYKLLKESDGHGH